MSTVRTIEAFILDIINRIEKNSLTRETLSKFPIGKLNPEKSRSLLTRWLSVAAHLERETIIRLLLSVWDESIPQDEEWSMSTFVSLFLNRAFPDDLLATVVRFHPEQTFVSVCQDLLKGGVGAREGADITPFIRAINIYGEQTNDIYRGLRELAQQMENLRSEEFFVAKMDETADFAPRPPWMISGELVSQQTLINDLPPIVIPPSHLSLEEGVTLLTSRLSDYGVDPEDFDRAQDVVRAQLAMATGAERRILLEPFVAQEKLASIADDVPHFQVLGPVNARVGVNLLDNHKCSKYGGCRMLLCDCFDTSNPYAFEEDLDDLDADRGWFTGVCDECHLRIQHPWLAVRRPLENGGWKGTYCSIECVKNGLTSSNPLYRAMIANVERQLDEVGILDRL